MLFYQLKMIYIYLNTISYNQKSVLPATFEIEPKESFPLQLSWVRELLFHQKLPGWLK